MIRIRVLVGVWREQKMVVLGGVHGRRFWEG